MNMQINPYHPFLPCNSSSIIQSNSPRMIYDVSDYETEFAFFNDTWEDTALTMSNLTNCSKPSTHMKGTQLSTDMTFNETNLMAVIVYSVLFFISAVGNLTVFITLFRNRHRRSRVNMFILHLSVADLIVTFIMMPLEIGWAITVKWNAGDAACRLFMFFRAFGFYLSSFILVTISLDRYFAITQPLSLNDADRRGKLMLLLAWLFSIAASIPQSVIFHVEKHPTFQWFTQCVTFNFFPTPAHELAYNLFNIIAVYVIPLAVIIISYSLILCEMSRKTRESKEQIGSSSSNGFRRREPNPTDFRRSGIGRIEKARTRTLKMTIVIVSVFIICWAPYFVMSTWWWFDHQSASKIHPKVQKGLFLFAVSNSCVNPIVYGVFAIDFVREFRNCCCCIKSTPKPQIYSDQRSHPNARHRLLHSDANPHSTKSSSAGIEEIVYEAEKPRPTRSITPPHIAHGKGTRSSFHRYLII